MDNTFKFVFTEDLSLLMTWVEENETVVVPAEYWPNNPEDIRNIAKALFPKFKIKNTSFKHKDKLKLNTREAHYKKIMRGRLEQFKVPSTTNPDTKYTISVIDKGRGREIHCSCPHYMFKLKNSGTYCIHIIEWLKSKVHPVSHEIAVQEYPSRREIPSLKMKFRRTLCTGDIDESLEKDFERQVINGNKKIKVLARRLYSTTR